MEGEKGINFKSKEGALDLTPPKSMNNFFPESQKSNNDSLQVVHSELERFREDIGIKINIEKDNKDSFIIVNGVKLNIPFKGDEKIYEATQLTMRILKIFKSNPEREGNSFYLGTSGVWKAFEEAGNDIRVKTGKLNFDVTYLTEERFRKTFGLKSGEKSREKVSEYTKFLNSVLDTLKN